MTELIWDEQEYWRFIQNKLLDAKRVDIASYGVILYKQASNMLNMIKGRNIPCRLLIGAPPKNGFLKLKTNTSFDKCVEKARSISKHIGHQMTCRVLPKSHFKCVIIYGTKPVAILGGRNWSPSTMFDCSIVITDKKLITDIINKFSFTWDRAFMLDQNINDATDYNRIYEPQYGT